MRELIARLDGWQGEQIEFLGRLVNHDSGTDDVLDVNRVGAILAERLESLGFTVSRVAQEHFGDHLVAEKPGRGPRRFLFVGHFDTVFPSGTVKERPFHVAGGRAYGPGVYDMKGGLTALLYALRAHREARSRAWDDVSIAIVFNADEERLSPTSRAVIAEQARRAHSVGILEICERVRVPGTAARFTGAIQFPPWPPGDPGTARLLEIMQAAGRDLGVEVKAIATGGGSDGNHTSQLAPTIDGLGPRGSRAHSEEEFIELATLLERTKMIAVFLERWAVEFEVPRGR